MSGIGLYVNVGGGNPGLHALKVGRRANGFVVRGAWVAVEGFVVTQTEDRAFQVSGANAVIRNNTVSFANKFGIQLISSAGSTVVRNVVSDNNDHGIFVSDTSTGALVQNNECFRNARPSARAANGINVNASPSSTVENNSATTTRTPASSSATARTTASRATT